MFHSAPYVWFGHRISPSSPDTFSTEKSHLGSSGQWAWLVAPCSWVDWKMQPFLVKHETDTIYAPPLYREIVIERFALQQRLQRGFIVHLQNNETGRWFGREENMFRSQKYANFCESMHNLQLQSIYFTTRPSGKVISWPRCNWPNRGPNGMFNRRHSWTFIFPGRCFRWQMKAMKTSFFETVIGLVR